MADFEFVSGNTKPYLAVQLLRVEDHAAVDLTGATVALYMRREEDATQTPTVNGAACVITNALNGKVEYRWAATDLDRPGFYTVEFRITFADAKKQSVLIDHVEVRARLG